MLRAAAIALCLVAGTAAAKPAPKSAPACRVREPSTFSVRELKIVGIVVQGNVRKVLVMDASDTGHILEQGDCIGRERVPFDGHTLPSTAPLRLDDAPFVEPPRPSARPVRA